LIITKKPRYVYKPKKKHTQPIVRLSIHGETERQLSSCQGIQAARLCGFVGAAAADVLSLAAGDLRELARVADALGEAEAGAAAARPFAKPAPQPGRPISTGASIN
jgi:hypothetical protein